MSILGGAVVAAMSGGGPNPVGLNDYHQPTSMDLHNHLNMHSQSQSQNLYFDDHLSNYSYNTQSAAPGGPFFDSTGAFSADVTAAAVLAAQQQVHGSTGERVLQTQSILAGFLTRSIQIIIISLKIMRTFAIKFCSAYWKLGLTEFIIFVRCCKRQAPIIP